LAVAQPPAITVGSAKSYALNQGTLTLILIFSVPFHAHISSTSLVPRSFPALWWLSVPQHRHSFSKKKLLASTAFFASLGVFIVLPHTNALRLFAHFFRRLPKGIYLKNSIIVLAIFQKNRAQNEVLSAKTSHQFNVQAFLL
jgi:hypothetical protein